MLKSMTSGSWDRARFWLAPQRTSAVLLDDLRDNEEAVGGGRGVAQGIFIADRWPDFIGSGDVDQRERVGRRLDS